MKNIGEILEKCINHKVTLVYNSHEESQLRETSGILVGVNAEVIYLKLYSNFGEVEDYYLNRHSCTLHSVIDLGKPKKDKK